MESTLRQLSNQSIQKRRPIKKRGILSSTSSIFDPFGILTPVILELKDIVRNIWKENLDRDDQIPEELRNWSVKKKNNFQNWKTLEIPRWYQTNKNSTTSYGDIAYFCFRNKGK